MESLSFVTFNHLCELNAKIKYINECIHYLKNEDCIYSPGIAGLYEYILSLYRTRLSIAKENGNATSDYIIDFEQLIENIENETSNNIGIASLYANNVSYMVFYNPVGYAVFGVLKMKHGKLLSDIETDNTKSIEEGLTCNMSMYSKGKFIRDWKKE